MLGETIGAMVRSRQEVAIANAGVALDQADNRYRRTSGLWLFQFGAYGTLYVAVWERFLEAALEQAAEWLAENATGHLIDHSEMRRLVKEAREELGSNASEEAVWEHAEADLTYTEAGWLLSYEWWVDEVDAFDPLYRRLLVQSFREAPEQLEDEEDRGRARRLIRRLRGLG